MPSRRRRARDGGVRDPRRRRRGDREPRRLDGRGRGARPTTSPPSATAASVVSNPGGATTRSWTSRSPRTASRRDLAPGFDDPNSGAEVRWFGSADHSQGHRRATTTSSATTSTTPSTSSPTSASSTGSSSGRTSRTLERVTVEVTFPGDGTDLRAFAHGVLHGVVGSTANGVALSGDRQPGRPVRRGTGSSLPPSCFTVPPTGGPALDRILAEEGAFADEANADARSARQRSTQAFADEVDAGLARRLRRRRRRRLERRCDELADLLERGRAPRRRGARRSTTPTSSSTSARRGATSRTRSTASGRRAPAHDRQRRRPGRRRLAARRLASCIWRRWGKEPDRPPTSATTGARSRRSRRR